ncbi:MAG: type II secretion system F family protein, partial [Candidatus Micrarchaeota archaeon]
MASETMGGVPLTQSLTNMSGRVRSVALSRAVMLINEGLNMGGEIASLLTRIAQDLRNNQYLQREIVSATSMYTLFIVFAAVIASPGLFAISAVYGGTTEMLASQQAVDPGMTEALDMSVTVSQGSSISPEEMHTFSLGCIIVTTLFGGLLIGMIKQGSVKKGLKYVPIFVIGAVGIYFAVYLTMNSLIVSLV